MTWMMLLVALLGHPHYTTRQGAEGMLHAAYPLSTVAMLSGSRSTDPEVQRRCERVLRVTLVKHLTLFSAAVNLYTTPWNEPKWLWRMDTMDGFLWATELLTGATPDYDGIQSHADLVQWFGVVHAAVHGVRQVDTDDNPRYVSVTRFLGVPR